MPIMRSHLWFYRSWKSLLASAALVTLPMAGLQAQTLTAVPASPGAGAPANLAPVVPLYSGTYPLASPCAPCLPPGFSPNFLNPPGGTGGTSPPGGMGETGVPGMPGMPGGTGGTGQSNDFSANAGGQGDGTGGGQGGLESAGGSAVGGETFIGA